MLRFTLRRAQVDGRERDLPVDGERVAAAVDPRAPALDLAGLTLLPGLVNGHDHLGLASFPALGRPPYGSVYDWTDDVRAGQGDPRAEAALGVPVTDRLLLGALRNLFAGVTAVVHHDPWHPALARRGWGALRLRLSVWRRHRVRLPGGFPLRVLRRYAQAHSPGLERDLAGTRPRAASVPWMLHAAEGRDARSAGEIEGLRRAGLLSANTVVVHGVATSAGDIDALARAGSALTWCPESNRQLYGATAPVAALRAAGVRLALGSDSPLSGVRDALSNLAVARRENVLADDALLRLATHDTAAVFGLPVGGTEPDAPADFVVVDDLDRLLAGDRRAIQLVIVAGRPVYGASRLMDALPIATRALTLDGPSRRLDAALGVILANLLARHPGLAQVLWLAAVKCA
jgi:cytosine/adenosine deaminase-related metal-dependent hydrolase